MGTWLNNYFESGNVQLENSLLSRILVGKRMIPDLLSDYFTGGRKKLFDMAFDCWGKSGEIDTAYLRGMGFGAEIHEAMQEIGSENSQTIAELHELWQKREIARTVLSAPHTYDNEDITTEQIIRRIQEGASKILLKNQDKKYNHEDAVLRLGKLLINGNTNGRDIVGYSTGLAEMDRYTSGIERGKTYALGALKKTGKSRFCVGLMVEMRKHGANVTWNALEMNEMQLNLCALANYSNIDTSVLRKKLNQEDMVKAQIAMNDLFSLGWNIIRERTAPELRARIVDLQNRNGVDVVVVDYIQRMQDKALRSERAQEVEALAKALADIAGELNVAMIVLSQLSKEAERLGKDEMPNMTHSKESQGLPESADCIITLHNPKRSELPYDSEKNYHLPEISCLVEQREGLSGARFKILGDLRTCRFLNHDNPYG